MKNNVCRLVLLASLYVPICAYSGDVTWTNANSGNWSVGINWDPNHAPSSADTAVINNGASVNLDISANISSVDLQNGSLTVAPMATLTLAGTSEIFGPLYNYGTVNWQGGILWVDYAVGSMGETNKGSIWNEPAAHWNIRCDQPMGYLNSGGAPFFNNAGILTKSGTSGTSDITVFFVNSGTVQGQSGTLSFDADANVAGSILTTSGAAVNFGGNLAITGPMTNLVASGVTLSGLSNLVASASLTNCTVNGAEKIIGTVCWASGVINQGGSLLVATNAVLNLTGTGAINGSLSNYGVMNATGFGSLVGFLNNYGVMNVIGSGRIDGPLTNTGTVNWQSGDLIVDRCYGNGGIWNLAGATWNIHGDQAMDELNAYYAVFNNAGTVAKSGTSGTNEFSVFLINSGTILAQSGTMLFDADANLAGNILTASGTAVNFGGNLAITGPMTNLVASGVTLSGLSNLVASASLTNCTLTGAEKIMGTINWANGTINQGGALTVATNGIVNATAGGRISGPLTNNGIVNWQSGDLIVDSFYGNGVIWNKPGAKWNIHCDQAISELNSADAMFNNSGTLVKTNASGTNTFDVVLNNLNSGLLDLRQGALALNNNSSLAGAADFQINGTNDFGSLYISGSAAFGGLTNSVILGANYRPRPGDSFSLITYDSLAANNFQFRTLNLSPAITWATNYGPDAFSISVLTIKAVNVAPTLPSIAAKGVYVTSALTVTNTASGSDTNATVTYGLVKPVAGAAIDSGGIVTWTPTTTQANMTTNITTIATSTDLLDLVNPILKATNTFTVIVYQRPALGSPTMQGNGTFGFSFSTLANYSYAIEYSTNLISWTTVTNFIGTGSPASLSRTNSRPLSKGFYRVLAAP